MKYGTYTTAEEYEEAIEKEQEENPDTFFDVVLNTKYMRAVTGLCNSNRDFELRYGRPTWRRYGIEIDSRTPLFFPAGKPLKTVNEIKRFRTKNGKRDRFIIEGFSIDNIGDYRLEKLVNREDGWPLKLATPIYQLFLKDFTAAWNYAMGKPASLKAHDVKIKQGIDGMPQLNGV
tara:strand:+ start:1994 stop:2518 length:525 start_codon:yes stop_codon:yes gene_type:complete